MEHSKQIIDKFQWPFPTHPASRASARLLYLFLSQNKDPLWFDRMIRGQVFPIASLCAILVSLPDTIPSGPCDADVVPFPIVNDKRKLCYLRKLKRKIAAGIQALKRENKIVNSPGDPTTVPS